MNIVNNKQKLKGIISSLIIFIMMFGIIIGNAHDSAYAKMHDSPPIENIFFYVKNSDHEDVLVKKYTKEEFLKLEDPSKTYYYTSIDALPTAVHTEAKGVTLKDIVNDVKYTTTVQGAKNIEFTEGGVMGFMPTDFNFYQPNRYENLYGVNRYYYPNLYANYGVDENGISRVLDVEVAKEGAIPAEPILSTTSYQKRMSLPPLSDYLENNNYIATGAFEGMLSDESSLRLCIPQTEEELENSTRTTHTFLKWVYGINLNMGDGKQPDIQAEKVAEPTFTITDNGDDTININMSCETPGADIYYSLYDEKYEHLYNPQTKYEGPITVDKPKANSTVRFMMHANKVGYSDAGIVSKQYPLSTPMITTDSTDNTIGSDIELSYRVDEESRDWVNAIKEIQFYDDKYMTLDKEKYDVSKEGIIKLDKSLFKEGVVSYKIKIIADGYADREVTQKVLNTPPTVITRLNHSNNDIEFIFEENEKWRKDVYVYVDGSRSPVRDSDIDKSQPGKYIIKKSANVFTEAREYDIVIERKNGDFTPVNLTQMIVDSSKDINYKKWDGSVNNKNVDVNKEWKINFNKDIDISTIKSNIYILEKNTNSIFEVTHEISSDGKSVILKHKKPFQSGKIYTIYINESVKDIKKSNLKDGLEMEFSVQ